MDNTTEAPPVTVRAGRYSQTYPNLKSFFDSKDLGRTKQVTIRQQRAPRQPPEVIYEGPNNLHDILAGLR